MPTGFDPSFSFNAQLWHYYSTNRGKIRSRYNDLTRKFLAYNDSEENPNAFLRKPQFEALEMYVFVKEFMNNKQVSTTGGTDGIDSPMRPIIPRIRAVKFDSLTPRLRSRPTLFSNR